MQKSRFKLGVSTIFLGLFLTGCAVDYSTKSAESIQSEYQTFDSTFDQSKSVIGPEVSGKLVGLDRTHFLARLGISTNKSTGTNTYVLVANTVHIGTSWLHLQSATLPEGKKSLTKKGTTNVSCSQRFCTYEEQITVVLDKADLKPQKPFLIRIESSRGSGILTLPAPYVDAFLGMVQKQ